MNKSNKSENKNALIFLLIPTIMVILGYFLIEVPYPPYQTDIHLAQIPLFLGLILLFIGFVLNKDLIGKKLKIYGWLIFAFFWSRMPYFLYTSEDRDIFNAVVCIMGVFVLCYLAYHEWLSIKRKEDLSCLNWIAGASSIAGLIYFIIEMTPIKQNLINIVASQSGALLNSITGDVIINAPHIFYREAGVQIIFACTAIQAMVVFVGMILALSKITFNRKISGLLITILPIYILNVGRNALVIFLVGNKITDFYMAHNVITKIGALFVMIGLLLLLVKLIPEILDEILSITELPKRNGPLEKFISKTLFGKNK